MATSGARSVFMGPRLRRLRRDLGLTQADMAADLEISAPYVALLERNQRPVTADMLLRLARTSPAASGARFVRASQGDLGAMVAARRESVNKHLGEWQRLGIVHLRQGLIYIDDEEALQRIVAANEM